MESIVWHLLSLLAEKIQVSPIQLGFYLFGLGLMALIFCYEAISFRALFALQARSVASLRLWAVFITAVALLGLVILLIYICL
ncbi:MAG: hypothetical protein ILA34_07245 [Bacteroidaceae bacterium]|nr:hypothetical protein [Bacteroidaceae bacterium]